jgi:hypothetical protein
MQAIGCRRTRSCLGWRASALDAEEGHWLLCVWRSAHVHLGYGSFAQYYKPRTTQEKLRVAEALEALPRLVRALEAGALSWCAARELTRVALPETEAAWLDATRGKTLRELETLVANKASETLPTLQRPSGHVRACCGSRWLPTRSRPSEKRRIGYSARQGAAWTTTPSCSQWPASFSAGRATRGAVATRFRSAFAASVAAVCSQREASSCRSTRRSSTWPPATRSTSPSSSPAPPWTAHEHANLDSVPTDVAEGHSLDGATEPNGAQITTTRQSSNHVGAISRREKDASTDPSGSTAPGAIPQKRAAGADGHPSPRAKQSIPPALRRAVLTRDRRCRVPGCAHSTFVELHHLILRAAGKGS